MMTPHPAIVPVLDELFVRANRIDRWYRRGFAAAAIGIVATIVAYVVDGSGWAGAVDTPHEQQMMAALALVVAGALAVIVHSFWLRDHRRARYLESPTVWFYRVSSRHGQLVDLWTADGHVISLPIPSLPDGYPDEARIRRVFKALITQHPHALVGYSHERMRAYRRDPRVFLTAPA